MAYILVSTSSGDDLFAPQESVIAVSDSKEQLEQLRDQRKKDRDEYLATHEIPWFVQCSIIAFEEVKEVQSV